MMNSSAFVLLYEYRFWALLAAALAVLIWSLTRRRDEVVDYEDDDDDKKKKCEKKGKVYYDGKCMSKKKYEKKMMKDGGGDEDDDGGDEDDDGGDEDGGGGEFPKTAAAAAAVTKTAAGDGDGGGGGEDGGEKKKKLSRDERICGERSKKGGLVCDRKIRRWIKKEKQDDLKRTRRSKDRQKKYGASTTGAGCPRNRLRINYDGKFGCIKNQDCLNLGGTAAYYSDDTLKCVCPSNTEWDASDKKCKPKSSAPAPAPALKKVGVPCKSSSECASVRCVDTVLGRGMVGRMCA